MTQIDSDRIHVTIDQSLKQDDQQRQQRAHHEMREDEPAGDWTDRRSAMTECHSQTTCGPRQQREDGRGGKPGEQQRDRRRRNSTAVNGKCQPDQKSAGADESDGLTRRSHEPAVFASTSALIEKRPDEEQQRHAARDDDRAGNAAAPGDPGVRQS